MADTKPIDLSKTISKVNSSEEKSNKWFNRWISHFSSSFAIGCSLFISVFIIFSLPIKNVLNYVFINPIISTCPKNDIWVNLLFSSFLISTIIFLINRLFVKKLLPSINSTLVTTTLLIVYIFYFRLKSDLEYEFYCFWELGKIYYSDLIILFFIAFGVSYKSYRPTLSVNNTFLTLLNDQPSSKYEDEYGRDNYASKVALHINATTSETSFAIAVIGEWGLGKTDFLLRLKSNLDLDNNNKIIEFNPWRISKSETMVEEFFKVFSDSLKPYNSSVSSKIKEYSKRILQSGKEAHYKLIDTLIEEFFPEKNVEEQYRFINESIKLTGKRFIVLIDDVDRLNGKEVMEVLRIVRNTANFANTFFIVAFENKYIVDVLRKTNLFTNEEEYLKKVFQLAITLPTFKKEIITPIVKRILLTGDLSEIEKKKIEQAIESVSKSKGNRIQSNFSPRIDNLFEDLLNDIRDVKRFCNSFKIAFNILKKETNIHDLMVLELIRNRDIDVYNRLRKREFLKFEASYKPFGFDESKWNIFIEENKQKANLNDLKGAVMSLVSDQGIDDLDCLKRKFADPHNFYLYFSYQLFNLISLEEFNRTFEKDEENMFSQFKIWIEANKGNELLKIVNQIEDFSNTSFFEKVIIVYLRVSTTTNDGWFGIVKTLLFSKRQENLKRYFKGNKQSHEDFIKSIITNNRVSPYKRAALAFDFLYEHLGTNIELNELIFTKIECQRCIYKLFDEYLNTLPLNLKEVLNFYRLNYDVISGVNRLIRHTPVASRRLRKYLLSNKNLFQEYTRNIFKTNPGSFGGNLVFDWWLEQIFPNWQDYKKTLVETEFDNDVMSRIKLIVLQYIVPFYINGKVPFIIANEGDKLFIEEIIKGNDAE